MDFVLVDVRVDLDAGNDLDVDAVALGERFVNAARGVVVRQGKRVDTVLAGGSDEARGREQSVRRRAVGVEVRSRP